MRRAAAFMLILTGTVFCVFLFNIILYAAIPAYREAIGSKHSARDDIPVVTVTNIHDEDVPLNESAQDDDNFTASMVLDGKDYPTTYEETKTEDSSSGSLQIVNKEYHEDCGTGKGYWVITYDDGSVVIE